MASSSSNLIYHPWTPGSTASSSSTTIEDPKSSPYGQSIASRSSAQLSIQPTALSPTGSSSSHPGHIQISLPPNQPNTLALKTAQLSANIQNGNTSIFQIARHIKHRLLTLRGFSPYLDYNPSPDLGFSEGEINPTVVEHVWWSLRTGSSFVFLVNRVGQTGVWADSLKKMRADGSSHWVNIEGEDIKWDMAAGEKALNWMVVQMGDPKKKLLCQKPLYKTLSFLMQLKDVGGWPNDELWSITDLYKPNTNSFVKILHTATLLLDKLPATQSPTDESFSPVNDVGSSNPFGYQSSSQTPIPTPGASTGYNAFDSLGPKPLYPNTPGSASNGFFTGIHAIPGAITPGGAALMGGMGSASQLGSSPLSIGEAENLVKELVETERKYVQELEVLHQYSESLLANDMISLDTAHHIFSNLHVLLDFQRKFQISLETEAEKADGSNWRMGDWGKPFIKHEREFECYGPFCANYTEALEMVQTHMPQLSSRSDLILEPTREVQAFLIKPIQRITKYPLLLSSLVKASSPSDNIHHQSLLLGVEAVKRITEKVNETRRAKENEETKIELMKRVSDWKDHDPLLFGDLVIDEHLIATKGGSDRDYHVFLFEKMLLCCKDGGDKVLKKGQKLLRSKTGSNGFNKNAERSQYFVKGRIYCNNLTHTEIVTRKDGGLGLQVYWRSQEAPDTSASFVLHMKNDESLRKWDSQVKRLIQQERRLIRQAAANRANHHSHHSQQSAGSSFQPHHRSTPSFTTDAFSPRSVHNDHDETDHSAGGWETDGESVISGVPRPRRGSEAQSQIGSSRRPTTSSRDNSSDVTQTLSGRGRARTEEFRGNLVHDWRTEQQQMQLQQQLQSQMQMHQQPVPAMPSFPRNVSMPSSTSSIQPDPSWNNVIPTGGTGGGLSKSSRTQMSLSNTRRHHAEDLPAGPPSTFNNGPTVVRNGVQALSRQPNSAGLVEHRNHPQSMAPNPSRPVVPYRNRSASSPMAYQAQQQQQRQQQKDLAHPPMPSSSPPTTMTPQESSISSTEALVEQLVIGPTNSSKSSLANSGREVDKRASGESTSTSISDESQSSPATPFGSSGPRRNIPVRMGSEDSNTQMTSLKNLTGPTTMMRIHFEDDVLMINVPVDSEIESLKTRVFKKIARGRPEYNSKRLQMKYRDLDEDLVLLKTQEDWEVCMADLDSQQIELEATLLDPLSGRA
ncbi:Invasion-inducing protein TIAM1/CDC24 and related RhoGEF GTPases [Phaffia rhodozyma]|uniref:Invasion-inducing protein TIAM1/CDC24 and related RhoGEF GTPases n=1 Tax=Phaffia rhodozyma TaxID=264483 RepID=A0A0F7SRI7_PHARH|nr:Invasion-inducing protein TIAM1/CDC24 and related RhoGEF GTPases [Phaffia rhodozyma]